MAYIDGFVAAVPAVNKERYRRHAEEAAPLFREFGATRLVETWGDEVPVGKLTDFKGAVQANDDEVVVFGWFEFPDKAARDAAQERMNSDPRMSGKGAAMPFDGKRMIFGGFEPLLDLGDGSRGGYVDGFLVAVPEDAKAAYVEIARLCADVFMGHGAVRVVEAWEDDVPDGTLTDMRRAVQAKAGEKIVFSWIEWTTRGDREASMKKVTEDPRMQMDHDSFPFDGKRMIYGSFEVIVEG